MGAPGRRPPLWDWNGLEAAVLALAATLPEPTAAMTCIPSNSSGELTTVLWRSVIPVSTRVAASFPFLSTK